MRTIQTARCRRCGIERNVKPERGVPDLCRDCRLVEADLAAMTCPLGYASRYGQGRHLALGEPPCDACLAAHAAAERRRSRRRGVKPRPIPQCGTVSGYSAHQRRGEASCAACRRAWAEHKRQYRQQRKVEVAA